MPKSKVSLIYIGKFKDVWNLIQTAANLVIHKA